MRRVPLADAALLGTLPRATQEELLAAAEPIRLEAQAWLFREGDRGDRLYFVVSGRLRVVVEREGATRVARLLGPGAAIGELAVLTGSPRSASVQAVRDCELLELDGERFLALLASDRELGHALATALARQLQASGGLAEPDVPPGVFAVAPLPRVDCRAFAEELCTAFGSLGRTAVLERPATDDWGAEVAALEEEHAAVVLLALEDGPWRDFCARQSDRVLAVATGPPGAEVRLPEGCDIAFLGAEAARSLSAWRTRVALRTHHVVAPDDPGAPARVARRLAGTSLGLVLSGGGARGFAHLGVLDVLSRESLEIDRVGGTSMGAFIAAMAALGWEPERMIETCKTELAQRAPFSDYTVPRHALTRARRVESMLRRVFGDVTLEELSRPLFTVSADLITGQMVVHRDGQLADAVGASMTIPGLAPPRAHEAQLLIDGGIINNLPIDLMVAEEPGPVVAVDVMRRIVAEDLRATVRTSLPTILETISRATVLGSIERAEANRELAGVVISPEVHDVSLRDFRRIDEVIEAGRRAAEASLAAGVKDGLLAARSLPAERAVPLARTSA